jgi:hypothetical protein
MTDEDLTKEIGKLLELARNNPAFKIQPLKSQATRLIHSRDKYRDQQIVLAARKEGIDDSWGFTYGFLYPRDRALCDEWDSEYMEWEAPLKQTQEGELSHD